MAFTFTDAHINDYHQLGFTIFRQLIPDALLGDLRREADKGRTIARQRHGDQAQRLQPIVKHPELDIRPFDELFRLPQLQRGLNELFASTVGEPVRVVDSRAIVGILYEPATMPYCTKWHRDWRDNAPGLRLAEWDRLMLDMRYFNQVNCALHDDDCTWVVPGSHLRRDTAAELRRFPERPILAPTIAPSATPEEAERICLGFTAGMPGAFQARLNAGDYMLYRNSLWHIGNYVPYKKRATIHDAMITPEYEAFYKTPPYHSASPNGEAPVYENPHLSRPEYLELHATAR